MAKKQYPVIVDAENKIIFPSAEQFISANPELGLPEQIKVEDGGDITINDIINTNGIHERQLYEGLDQGSYEYKGWYFASDFTHLTNYYFDNSGKYWDNEYEVLLGDTQQEYSTIKSIKSDNANYYDASSTILSNLKANDILTFKNSANYIDSIKVISISGNRLRFKYIEGRFLINNVTLNNLYELAEYTTDNPVNASVRCSAKPNAGPTVISGGSTATNVGGGSNTVNGYFATVVGGRQNKLSGDYSVVAGEKNNVTGKTSVILGTSNTNNQELNYVLGHSTNTKFRNGFAVGHTLSTTNNYQAIFGINNDRSYTEPYSVVLSTGMNLYDIEMAGGNLYEYYNSIEASQKLLSLRSIEKIEATAGQSLLIKSGGETAYSSISFDRQRIDLRSDYFEVVNGYTARIEAPTKISLESSILNLTTPQLNANINIGAGIVVNNSGFTATLGKGLVRNDIDGDQRAQVIVGQYNKAVGNGKVSGTPCFIVGNGSNSARNNAIEVYTNKVDINNDVNINGNLTTTAFTTSNFSTNNISINNSDNFEFCKLTNNSLLFKRDLTLSGDDTNKDEVLLTREKLVFTGQESTPMGTFAPGHICVYDRDYASFEVKSIGFDPYSDGRMQLTISDGERARSEIGSGTIKIEPTSIVITEVTGQDGDYGNIFSELTITPTSISSSNLSFNINGNSNSDDAKSDSIVISNSNGITITPSLETQLKNRVGNVHIDGTSISINPAGNLDDWGSGENYKELFEGGHQLKMTNTGISLYDEYNNLAATIDAYGITGGKGWTGDFSIGANSIYLKPANIDNNGQTFRIDTTGILSNNKYITIGCNPEGGYEVSTGELYYANIGKYELNGLLTSKTIYDYTNSNKVVTPSDYTETLLDKLTTTVSGMEFNPETETYEYSYSTGDTTNFEKVAVGLDYFYNVIKELNNRIKELESQSSNQDQESVRLKIKGTNEYCTVTAEKDSSGAITLSVENA